MEFDDEDVVSPSRKPLHWTLLGEWDTTAALDSEIKDEILHLETQHMSTSGLVKVPSEPWALGAVFHIYQEQWRNNT